MREKSKLRESDEKVSNKVGEYLNSTFYKEETTKPERIEEVEMQVMGVDTIFTLNKNGKIYYCDEKTTAQYRDIQTFTLELSFLGLNGMPKEGWLTDDSHINNSFLLVWLDSDGVEIALIEKESILNHLQSLGWTKEALRLKASQIRKDYPNVDMGDLNINGCRFIFSTKLVEKPINIMLTRDTYKKIAVFTKKYRTDIFAKKDY